MFARFSTILLLALATGSITHAQVAAGTSHLASEKDGSLRGNIVDKSGAAIQAFVLVHSDRWIKINSQIPVNKNGEFEIQLEPGLYDLFVASPGFLPIARVIEIKSEAPTNLNLTMQLDEEHLQGDGIS